MKNLKVTIAYNGFAYNGYQSQPNGNTVQDQLQRSMTELLNQPITVNGCSRTDAGVHARRFVFNALYDESLSSIEPDSFLRAMNGSLPHDIAVLSCEYVPLEFHARFCAKGKEYLYLVDTSKVRNVFSTGLALHYPYEIDVPILRDAASLIIGQHDFAAFCKAEAKEHLKSTVRTVTEIKIEKNQDQVEFYVSGDGFLHNMVRIIVGTLIYVNENKRSKEDVKEALETGNREKAGKTLPPHGLYLNKVFY